MTKLILVAIGILLAALAGCVNSKAGQKIAALLYRLALKRSIQAWARQMHRRLIVMRAQALLILMRGVEQLNRNHLTCRLLLFGPSDLGARPFTALTSRSTLRSKEGLYYERQQQAAEARAGAIVRQWKC